jgi:uncharacterized damage-inducible protein DinB
MKTDDIKLLHEYNYWADLRILKTCSEVSAEQYAAPTNSGIGHRSLRATLVHILDGEWQWRITCQGSYATLLTDAEYDATELTEAQFPTLHALEERWQAEQREMRAYIGTLSDEKLNGILRYTTPGGSVRERVLWHCLFHAVNHGTQHRSEAAALLTSYGQSPGDFDFTLFLNEHFNLPS